MHIYAYRYTHYSFTRLLFALGIAIEVGGIKEISFLRDMRVSAGTTPGVGGRDDSLGLGVFGTYLRPVYPRTLMSHDHDYYLTHGVRWKFRIQQYSTFPGAQNRDIDIPTAAERTL